MAPLSLQKNENSKNILPYLFAVICFIVAGLSPNGDSLTGFYLFLPLIFILVYVVTTKRMLIGFFLGDLLLYFMLEKNPLKTIQHFIGAVYIQLSDDSYQWIIIMATAIGALTMIIQASGSSDALTDLLVNKSKTKKQFHIFAWIGSILIFFDDYLQSMIMGPTLSPVAERKKTSKEMLSYIIKSNGIPFGVLVPVSVWSFFIIEQLEKSGIAAVGKGLSVFLKLIPYNFFSWISVLVGLLVILNVIPLFGSMKDAERKAETIEPITVCDSVNVEDEIVEKKQGKLLNFFLPMLVLIALIFLLDFDLAVAGIITLIFTFILYIPQGLLTPETFEDKLLEGGIEGMASLYLWLLLSMMLATGLENIGFIDYIIKIVGNSGVPGFLFPLLLFVVFSVSEFAVCLNWGLFIIVFPMIIPLCTSLGANPMLALGAVISSSVFGVNASPYSESTIMVSSFTNMEPLDHTKANLPYQLLNFILASIAFLIGGIFL